MNEEVVFNNWQEVIVDFFENKISQSELFKARKDIVKKNTEIEKLKIEISKIEKDEKKINKNKKAILNKQTAIENKLTKLLQFRKDSPQTEIRDWIEKNHNHNIAKGDRTVTATHVLKFTHSSSNPGGLLITEKSNDLLLSTASLKRKLTLDLAHKNGAHISISRFLALELKDEKIIDLILSKNFEFLKPFTVNKEQLQNWEYGFSNLVEVREINKVDKAKQLYFPLNSNFEKYHLITPLFASSLCNEVDTVIENLKYKEQKEINKYRNHKKNNKKSAKYNQSVYVDYPNLATQSFDKNHPNIISMLNANRAGKAYLFSAQSPIWQSRLKPPINKKSVFDSYPYSSNTLDNIKHIVKFILLNKAIGLSIRDPEKQRRLERRISYIIDDFWFYVGNIHNLTAGWSDKKGIKLKNEHQYLLDPYRADKEFQTNRKNTDWQEIVVNDFSIWLNKQLKNKDKKFTPQSEYSKIWKTLMEKELREYNQIIESSIAMEVSE